MLPKDYDMSLADRQAVEFLKATALVAKKYGKDEYVKFLEKTSNYKYNCEYAYEILDETGKSAIAKATYTFDSSTGLLVISGSGEIKEKAFWNKESIKKVIIN